MSGVVEPGKVDRPDKNKSSSMGSYFSTGKTAVEPCQKIVDTIVAELKDDATILRNWESLAAALGLPASSIRNFTRQDNAAHVIRLMVEEWHSMNQKPTIAGFCEILSTEGYKNAAARIGNRKNPFDGKRIRHSLGESIEFHGREKELAFMGDCYEKNRSPLYIHGAAGYGKTELAFKFCSKVTNQTENHDSDVNIVILQGESVDKLLSSIGRVWKEVKKEKNPPFVSDLSHINCLKSISGRTIVVIDNVDHHYHTYSEVVSKLKQVGCFVIVTTRNKDCVEVGSDASYPSIALGLFNRTDSTEFVKHRLPNESPRNIERLCEELNDWPLALVTAVAFIKRQKIGSVYGESYNARQYIAELDTSPGKLLNSNDPAEVSLGKTMRVCIDRVGEEGGDGIIAVGVIKLLAYLDGDGISLESLEKVYHKIYPDVSGNITPSCLLLQRYSLVKFDRQILTVHRMAQRVVRLFETKTNNSVPETLQKLVGYVFDCKLSFPANDTFNIVKIWEHILESDDMVTIEKYLCVSCCVSNQLLELSHFSLATDFCTKNFKMLKNKFQSRLEYLTTEYNYCRSLSYQLMHEASYKFLLGLLSKIKEHLGPKHDLYFSVELELASVVRKQGKSTEAKKLYENISKYCEQNYGPEHRLSVTAEHGIAICYLKEKKFIEAEELFEKVLKCRENFGRTQPAYLRTLCYLGECKFERKLYEECTKTFKNALKLMLGNKSYHEQHKSVKKSIIIMSKCLINYTQEERLKIFVEGFNNDKFFLCAALRYVVEKFDRKDIFVFRQLLQILRVLLDEIDEVDSELLNLIVDTDREMRRKSNGEVFMENT